MGDGLFSGWHLLILAGVFVLLFGAKRLPDAARSLGKSMRIFKTEVKGLHDDDTQPATPPSLPPGQSATTPAAGTPTAAAPTAAAPTVTSGESAPPPAAH